MSDATPNPQDAGGPPIEPGVKAGHSYDGIQEYDNPTPFWWNALFIASILFAPIYVLWFHSPYASNTHAARYEVALAANLRKQFGELGDLPQTGDTVVKYMNDQKWQAVGQATFLTHCASCHGKNGAGISAPNLTDDLYVHVKQPGDIVDVLQKGRKAGSMPAWENRLHPNELVLTAAYVASMRGKDLDGKNWPGEKPIDPWPAAPAE